MTVAVLLDRLEGVRQVGPGRWVALCSAHQDRRPSLSIRETSDGTILIYDFAGCSPTEVLAAVGLELRDLFPQPLNYQRKPRRDRKHKHAAREALECLHSESLVLLIAARALARGQVLDERDQARLEDAAMRIAQAREAAV